MCAIVWQGCAGNEKVGVGMFVVWDGTRPGLEGIRGLGLTVVRLAIVQVTKLLL
jgi:hypothetical protein